MLQLGQQCTKSQWAWSTLSEFEQSPGVASDAVPLGPNTVISLTTTTMEETAAVAVVEAVVVDVVEITVAAGQHPDLPGEITSQEAGGN